MYKRVNPSALLINGKKLKMNADRDKCKWWDKLRKELMSNKHNSSREHSTDYQLREDKDT